MCSEVVKTLGSGLYGSEFYHLTGKDVFTPRLSKNLVTVRPRFSFVLAAMGRNKNLGKFRAITLVSPQPPVQYCIWELVKAFAIVQRFSFSRFHLLNKKNLVFSNNSEWLNRSTVSCIVQECF